LEYFNGDIEDIDLMDGSDVITKKKDRTDEK